MSKSIEAYSDEERVRRYDADMDLLHPNRHKMVDVALEVLPYPSDSELFALDLGIGTGFFTSEFLKQYPNAVVIGVDGSDAMLRLAQTRLRGIGGRVNLKCVPFEAIKETSFGAEPFDVVFSSYALHHLDEATKGHVLTTAVHRLKTNGWLINADMVSSDFPDIERIIQDVRARGIVSRNKGADPRFSGVEKVRAFIDEVVENEADQPLSLERDVQLLRESGIANTTVFWQEFREVVYGGYKTVSA